jgi:hypothetical protein
MLKPKKISQKQLEIENMILDYLIDTKDPQSFESIRAWTKQKCRYASGEDICWCLEDLIQQNIVTMHLLYGISGTMIGYKYAG